MTAAEVTAEEMASALNPNGARSDLPSLPPFPVDSFREAAQHLRRPFTPAAVKFKVQATWPKNEPTGGLIVSYIDARLVVERLNLICPHLWTADEYQPIGGGQMWCALTIDGITRRDVGEGQGKGLVSDALKRAAVKFGVGVSLYAVPKMMLNVSAGHLKQKKSREGQTLELTPAGEKFVRSTYATWLDEHGRQAFGEPLDHGDSEGAQGDAEIEVNPETGEVIEPTAEFDPTPEPDESPAPVLDEEIVKLVQKAYKATGEDHDWLRTRLVALGVADVPEGTVTKATIRTLTPEQADELIDTCNAVAEAKAGQS